MARQQQEREDTGRALATVEAFKPSRLPIAPHLLEKMEITEGQWNTLCDQIFPAARSADAIWLALNYCRTRNLDIYKKPVNIVPMYSSALKRMVETCWPSIVEIRTTAARTGTYAGISEPEFGPLIQRKFEQMFEDERDPRNNRKIELELQYPEWCKLTVERLVGGEPRKFHAQVFWVEAYATAGRNTEMPNEMWRKRTFGQLDKCTEAAALRKAFPEELGNTYAAEEMAGRVLYDDDVAFVPVPERPRPQRPPAPRTQQRPADTAPTRDEAAADAAEDADYSVIDDQPADGLGDGDLSDTQFMEELSDRMGEARNAAEAQTIWDDFKPEERFAGQALNLEIVGKIRAQAMRRWEKQNA